MLSFKIHAVLTLISTIAFFTLAIFMQAGYDVAYTESFTGTGDCTTANPCQTLKYLVGNGSDQTAEGGNSSMLGWIFMAIGIFSVLLFFMEMI